MCTIFKHYFVGLDVYRTNPDLDVTEQNRNTSSILKITWKLDHWTKENQGNIDDELNIAASEPFQYGENKLFRAKFKMWKNPKKSTGQQFILRFLSYGHEKISCYTEEVTCSIDREEISSTEQSLKMIEEPTKNNKILQLFTIRSTGLTFPLSLPLFITFRVELRSISLNYINKAVDSSLSGQLWDAAVNRLMTDVEFHVGEATYGAHRSLLSARSPVFAAMFASGMKEAATGQVHIEDVDETTFVNFLKFLYTGMFDPSAMTREVFMIADKYEVETLTKLCRPASETVDVDDIFDTILSSC